MIRVQIGPSPCPLPPGGRGSRAPLKSAPPRGSDATASFCRNHHVSPGRLPLLDGGPQVKRRLQVHPKARGCTELPCQVQPINVLARIPSKASSRAPGGTLSGRGAQQHRAGIALCVSRPRVGPAGNLRNRVGAFPWVPCLARHAHNLCARLMRTAVRLDGAHASCACGGGSTTQHRTSTTRPRRRSDPHPTWRSTSPADAGEVFIFGEVKRATGSSC